MTKEQLLPTAPITKKVCPICNGERGYYEPCGDDYSMMWLACSECDGLGEIKD